MTSQVEYNVATPGSRGVDVPGMVPMALDINGVPQAVSNANPTPMIDAYLAPVNTSWTSATPLNSVVTMSTGGMDTVALTIIPPAGLTAGQITFQVWDGYNWFAVKSARQSSYNTDSTFNLAGSPGQQSWTVPVAGFPQFQIILNQAIVGSGTVQITTIVSSAPDVSIVTIGVDPLSALPTHAVNTITNGVSQFRYFTPAATTPQVIKSSAGKVHRINCINNSASARYLRFYNNATVTVGSTAVVKTFLIPATSQVEVNADMLGLYFSTAIACAVTGGFLDTDTTAPAANDVLVQVEYA